MLKFLLILALICYIIYRVGGFLFKMIFMNASQYQRGFQNDPRSQSRKAPDSNLKVDYVPERDKRSGKDFKGGQYVDFEEVKD